MILHTFTVVSQVNLVHLFWLIVASFSAGIPQCHAAGDPAGTVRMRFRQNGFRQQYTSSIPALSATPLIAHPA